MMEHPCQLRSGWKLMRLQNILVQCGLQPPDCYLLGFGLDLYRHIQIVPALREVSDVDEIVVTVRLWPLPTFERTGDVDERLTIPYRHGSAGRLLNAQAIGVEAVVVNVVDQREAHGHTEAQKVRWRV